MRHEGTFPQETPNAVKQHIRFINKYFSNILDRESASTCRIDPEIEADQVLFVFECITLHIHHVACDELA